MKNFQYIWDNDCYILHVQFKKNDDREYIISIIREFTGGNLIEETETIRNKSKSHRFVVSRSHTNETGFKITYPDNLLIEVFKIDDRAYYPTKPFFSDP